MTDRSLLAQKPLKITGYIMQSIISTLPLQPCLATLPIELKIQIFERIASPPLREIGAYARYQAEHAQMCLICKSTLPAVRTALFRRPMLHDLHGWGNERCFRTLLSRALHLGKGNGLSWAPGIQAFSYANDLFGNVKTLHLTILLVHVFDSSPLRILHLTVGSSFISGTSRSLVKIINALRQGRCEHSLVSIRLKGLDLPKDQLQISVEYFYTFPLLRHLHLEIKNATCPCNIRQFALDHITPRSPLHYISLGFNSALPNKLIASLVESIPRSVVVLGLFLSRNDTSSRVRQELVKFANVRYLGTQQLMFCDLP